MEGPRFKFLPVHGYADSLSLFCSFPSGSPRHFLKLGHDHFISRPFECTIFSFLSFPVLPSLLYVQRVTVAIEHTPTHTHTHTYGKTPLDKGSARRRDINPTKHSPQKRQKSLPPAAFETAAPVSKRPQTYVLHCVANGTDRIHHLQDYNHCSTNFG